MKLCAGNYYIDKYGKKAGAARMAELGYGYLDFDLSDTENEYYAARDEDFIVKLLAMKKALSEGGVSVYLVKGPTAYTGDDLSRAEAFEKMTKAMVAARHLGAKYMTVPTLLPSDGVTESRLIEINAEYFSALAIVAEKLGVTICLENAGKECGPLATPEGTLKLARKISHTSLKLSLDTAYAAECGASVWDAISEAEDLLAVVHAADTDGSTGSKLPLYSGGIDWSLVAEALFGQLHTDAISITVSPILPGADSEDEDKTKRLEAEAASYARLLAM